VITTEGLLTSRSGFGIATATPCQRAACRIIDGRPLGELATDPNVVAFVGGAEALSRLPSEQERSVAEVVFLAAIRSAKTIVACAKSIQLGQSVDVSKLGPGEIPRVSIVSLKLDTSAVAFRLIVETIQASPLLKKLLVGQPTADSVMLRHPSGRPVEIKCVAGTAAGGGLVARWSAGVIFDEAPRMNGAEDAVINLDHARTAVLGRLLPGACVLYIGSPWAPSGPIYELTQEFWRRPTDHLVVLRGTGPMLNPHHWTPERCEKLRVQNETAYQTDVLGEFADPESGLLSPVAVKRNTRVGALELQPMAGGQYCAAIDAAEGTHTGNAWTFVVVQFEEPKTPKDPPRFRVALVREYRGMRPDDCWQAIAADCHRYRVREVWSDQYAASANRDLAARYELHVNVDPTTASSKLADFTNLATLLHTDALELAPHATLLRDLLSVRKRVTQTGFSIVLPRTADGRHADTAPALALALKHARRAVADPWLLRGARPSVAYSGGQDRV
jgi:hypothetical protein